MKSLLLILFVAILLGNAEAGIVDKLYPTCTLQSDTSDSSLAENQSKYTFEFSPLDGTMNQMIYSIDGVQKTAELNGNSLEILTVPGIHIFQFYYSENYYEAYTDSLRIQNQHHSIYDIRMERANHQFTIDKPIIYLYPEEEIDVELKLEIKGKPIFYYPEYQRGWKFTASPNGDLTFGDKTYNYLFWEASQKRSFSKEELKAGFNVKKENVTSFLEEKLDLAGLNSKEQADFITYWGPRLSANDLNFVRFEFNEDCDRYAKIAVNPKPKTIYRIYIVWMPIQQELDVTDQEIEAYSRKGFTVLEWGGTEITGTLKF